MNVKEIKLADEMANAMIKCIENDLNGFFDSIDDMEQFNKYVQGLFGLKLANLMSNDKELQEAIKEDEEASAVFELLKIFSGGNN